MIEYDGDEDDHDEYYSENESDEINDRINLNLSNALGLDSLVFVPNTTNTDRKMIKLLTDIVTQIESLTTQETLMRMDYPVDLRRYNSQYMRVIWRLIETIFGKEGKPMIYWYIHNRFDEQGNQNFWYNPLTKEEVHFNSIGDLWSVLKRISENGKKKGSKGKSTK